MKPRKTFSYYLSSESEDGTYYLVNGWNKYKAFWTKEFKMSRNSFKSAASARGSLTKLLNVMPEYSADSFRIGCAGWGDKQ